jgi:hypothetical protein
LQDLRLDAAGQQAHLAFVVHPFVLVAEVR